MWGGGQRSKVVGPRRRRESRDEVGGFTSTRSRCRGAKEALARCRNSVSFGLEELVKGSDFRFRSPGPAVPRPRTPTRSTVHSGPECTLGCSGVTWEDLQKWADVTVYGNDVAFDTLISQNGGR